MKIGIPREIKPREGRIALLPDDCARLIEAGHEVLVERGAGELSGYTDGHYRQRDVTIAPDAETLYAQAGLIVKVKEPLAGDLELLKPHHVLFCFLHLAAMPDLTDRLCNIGLTAIGFETVQNPDGSLPLLAPMSAIAGRVSVQVGTHLLHHPQGGRGLLLGGVAGASPGNVVVVGAGVAGTHAATLASAIGANVTVFDKVPGKLRAAETLGPRVRGLPAEPQAIADATAEADLVVGAVLVPGARAPTVVSAEMVRAMPAGSVIADISVDQGGCIETTRPVTYDDPVYREYAVIHFTVTNMPGAVPRTASQALSHAIIPYVRRIADAPDLRGDKELASAINVRGGRVVHPALSG